MYLLWKSLNNYLKNKRNMQDCLSKNHNPIVLLAELLKKNLNLHIQSFFS